MSMVPWKVRDILKLAESTENEKKEKQNQMRKNTQQNDKEKELM